METWIEAEREGGLHAMQRAWSDVVHRVRPEARAQVEHFIEDASPDHAAQLVSWAGWERQQGLEQGRRAVLRRLLEQRFGALTPVQEALLDRADAESLDRWTDRLFTASSAAELLGG